MNLVFEVPFQFVVRESLPRFEMMRVLIYARSDEPDAMGQIQYLAYLCDGGHCCPKHAIERGVRAMIGFSLPESLDMPWNIVGVALEKLCAAIETQGLMRGESLDQMIGAWQETAKALCLLEGVESHGAN